jgi:maleylpyruvate isomerase
MSAPDSLGWADEGQQRIDDSVAGLTDGDARAPSRLAGWSRGHVLTHLARNADALVNLLTWARTGVERPMYVSSDQRDADIEAGAGRTADELRADLRESAQRFRDAAAALSGEQWSAPVRTRAGREIAAAEVPWLRVREVWLHAVDLDVGVPLDEIPDEVAWRLVEEVAEWMASRVEICVELTVIGRHNVRLGTGAADGQLSGSAQRIAGWLTGRCDTAGLETTGTIPELPPWL